RRVQRNVHAHAELQRGREAMGGAPRQADGRQRRRAPAPPARSDVVARRRAARRRRDLRRDRRRAGARRVPAARMAGSRRYHVRTIRMAKPRWIAGADDAGLRLDKYLAAAERLGSRAKAATALARGKISVNDREASADDAARRLAAGDVVQAWMDRPGTAKRRTSLGDARDLLIVYEDDALIVLNKPAGVLAVPLERREGARSVFEDLKDYLKARRKPRPFVVHRIDRDTSGLVVFAKHAAAQAKLKDQFKRRRAERVYYAVVYGHPAPASGTWRDRVVWDDKALIQKETHPHDPRGKDAIARYRVIERLARAALIEVTLVTGRRNQIRLQAR